MLPILLFIGLESLQLGMVLLRQSQIDYATAQAALAGAAEPSVPMRCDRAQAMFDTNFTEPTDPVACTNVGEDFTVSAHYDVAIFSPFHEDPDGFWRVGATKTAFTAKGP